jgi:hypothetical protein
MTKPYAHIAPSVASEPIAQSFAALSPKQEAPALIDLLVNCNVKLESEPEGYRLYWNGSRWVVSNGVKLQEFAKLNDAIVKFTELIYT